MGSMAGSCDGTLDAELTSRSVTLSTPLYDTVRAASVEDFTADRRGRAKRWGVTGFAVLSIRCQGLGQLCVKGRRVYFVDMEHAAGIGHGRDLGVRGDFVGFADLWWPGHSTRVARPANSHDTPVPTELMCRIAPDLLEREPTDPIRRTATPTHDDQHESAERVEAQTCPFASGLVVRPTHLQRATHPCPDRVSYSLEEDRRVHTCGPNPAGSLR